MSQPALTQPHTPVVIPGLAGPLVVAPDMPALWRPTQNSFDVAAEAIIAAHHRDGAAQDIPTPDLKTWGVVPSQGAFALAPLGGHRAPMHIRSTAFSQFAGRLGVPVEYVRDNLPAKLQLACLNYSLQTCDQSTLPSLLRVRGNELSALVSARYAPLDAEQLLDTVRSVLVRDGLLDEVEVRAVSTGPLDLVRLIIPSTTKPVRVGDVSAAGLDVQTSAFGRSAVRITPVVWRLVCTNGMRSEEKQAAFSLRHVGDTTRLRDAVGEAIPSALAKATGLLDRWQKAVNVMIDDVSDEIDRWVALTQGERSQVKDQVTQEMGAKELPATAPLYDVVNAVTRIAHEATPERRVELEAFGGALLNRRT